MIRKMMQIMLLTCIIFLLEGCGRMGSQISSGAELNDEYEKNFRMSDATVSYRTEELSCKIGKQNIYGIVYIPDIQEKVPLIIFAHELCSTHESGEAYAKELASQGVAVYTFDFRGGSEESQSDGNTVGMSVMTEADDLDAVIQEAGKWDFVDRERIALMGASQGGMASAIAATRNQEQLSGLILLYPALLVRDEVQGLFENLEDVPDQFYFKQWIMVGKNYVADVWNYDVYEDMKKFEKAVLILHGNRDGVVDVSYSERAAEAYPEAELHVLSGGGHVFYGDSFQEAVHYITAYLQKLQFIK